MRPHSGFLTTACTLLLLATQAFAAHEVTVQTTTAEPGQTSLRVDVYAHNEVELLEYFNLLVFDDTRLEYVDLVADRGSFWYGYYPTHVEGNRIYVHGWAVDYPDCIDPDPVMPGAPLFHLVFNVKPGAPDGFATVAFSSEGAFDGHWNNCGGYSVRPAPLYHDGGVDVASLTGVRDGGEASITTSSYPNPSTGSTCIAFEVARDGMIEVTVYDLAGRRVRTIAEGLHLSGSHDVFWDGTDESGRAAPGGIYFCRIRTSSGIAVEKIQLVR